MLKEAFLIVVIIFLLLLLLRRHVREPPPLAQCAYTGLLYVDDRTLQKKNDMLINYVGVPACVPMYKKPIPDSDLDIAAYMISQNS